MEPGPLRPGHRKFGPAIQVTAAQVRAMVEAVGDRYRALVVLLAGSALRPGEALGLTVDRVDFLRRTIRVDRQLVTVAGAPHDWGRPRRPGRRCAADTCPDWRWAARSSASCSNGYCTRSNT